MFPFGPRPPRLPLYGYPDELDLPNTLNPRAKDAFEDGRVGYGNRLNRPHYPDTPPLPVSPPSILRPYEDPAIIVDLEDQFFTGPASPKNHKAVKPYTSVCILDPCLTIERHGGDLHIAARFNIESTILQYHSKKGDGNDLFFHDIVLQYLADSNNTLKESFVTWPESDPSRSFAVTRSTNSEVSGDVGLSGSGTPSANVSLGLSRSTELTVEYSVGSWSVSAHRVVNIENKPSSLATFLKLPQYQWYWAGTHEETKHLTADLKHTVKRHVVLKRIVELSDFLSPTHCASLQQANDTRPEQISHRERRKSTRMQGITASHLILENRMAHRRPARWNHLDDETIGMIEISWGAPQTMVSESTLRRALKQLLTFNFHTEVRVKRRHGRFHRILLLSGNKVKAKFLNPIYKLDFELVPPDDVIADLFNEGCLTTKIRIDLPTPKSSVLSISSSANKRSNKSPVESDHDEVVAETVETGRTATRVKQRQSVVSENEGEIDPALSEQGDFDDQNVKASKNSKKSVRNGKKRDAAAKSDVAIKVNQGGTTNDTNGSSGNNKVRQPPQSSEREIKSKSVEENDECRPRRTFGFPLGQTIDLSRMLERLKEQNHGKWDRLQGRDLETELGQPAVLSVRQIRLDRELRAEMNKVRNQENEKVRLMQEREREISEQQREVHMENARTYQMKDGERERDRANRRQKTSTHQEPHWEVARVPPMPMQIWKETPLRFESYGTSGGPSRIYSDGPQSFEPKSAEIDDDTKNNLGDDENRETRSQDDE